MNRRDALKAVFGIAAVAATGGLVLAASGSGLTIEKIRRAKAALVEAEMKGDYIGYSNPTPYGRQLHFQNFWPAGQVHSIQNEEWFAPSDAPPGPDLSDLHRYAVGLNGIET